MLKNTYKRVNFIYKITKDDRTFIDSVSYDFNRSECYFNEWLKSKIESLALIYCFVISYSIYEMTEILVKSVQIDKEDGEQLEI